MIKKALELISDCEDPANKLKEMRAEFEKTNNLGFNIFTTTSDTYNKEGFHSYIIENILNPKTKVIGNIRYLNNFIECLNMDKKNLKIEPFNKKNILVKREYQIKKDDHIDFLITNNKNAIIVESKINGATDQPNQLARYYKSIEDKGFNILAVVYMPLVPGKYPKTNYTEAKGFKNQKDFEKYLKKVEEKLVILPAINHKGKNDICHSFLNLCIEHSKGNETAKVYLEQYQQLLQILGEDEMAEKHQLELLSKIYSEKESISTAQEISEVWEKREELLAQLVQEKLINEYGFKVRDYDDDPNTIIKIINEKISIGMDYESFGFFTTEVNAFFGNAKFKLQDMINQLNIDFLGDFEMEHENVEYVCNTIEWDKLEMNIQDIVNSFIEAFDKLEELLNTSSLVKK